MWIQRKFFLKIVENLLWLITNQQIDCLLNSLFGLTTKETSKVHITGTLSGKPPVTGDSLHKGPVMQKMFSRHDVIMYSSEILILITDSGNDFKSIFTDWIALTHCSRVMHICISKLTIIGSHDGLSPGRCQAIIWTNDGILLIRALGTNFSETLSKIHILSFKKYSLKYHLRNGHNFVCLGLNVWAHCLTLAGEIWE